MADVLNLLSFQTFTNTEYTEDRNPDDPLVKRAINNQTSATVVDKSQLQQSARSEVPALLSVVDQDKLYLAQACGNCARAYGTPLVCAAFDFPVSALTCCDAYLSPFSLT